VFFGDLDNALVRVFDVNLTTGALTEAQEPTPVFGSASTVDLRPDGLTLYVQEEDLFFEVFSVGSHGNLTAIAGSPFSLDTANGAVGGYISAISPIGDRYAIGSGEGVAVYALAANGTPSLMPGSPQIGFNETGVGFSYDGALMYSAVSTSGALNTFDVTGGSVVEVPGSPFAGTISIGALAPIQTSMDGTMLFFAQDSGLVFSVLLDANGLPTMVASSSTVIANTSGLAVTF
jgi:hypothetical protein